MPSLDPAVIALLATVSNIIVQVVKGLLPEEGKKWIPLGVIVLLMGVGSGLAAAYGRDLIAGLLEGLFGGASSIGLYEVVSSIPGISKVYNDKGWIPSSAP